MNKLKPGDLVRYRKEFEHRAGLQSNGILVGIVISDIADGKFDDPEEQMLDVLFGGEPVFMFGKELELVKEE